MRSILAIGLLVLGMGLPGQDRATPARLCPVDEGLRDPSLVAFREKLLLALRSRDVRQVRPLIAEDVYVEIGAQGIELFERVQDLSNQNSPFWESAETVLGMGGKFVTPSVFCAPYMSCPDGGLGSGYTVIAGERVPAHELPSQESRVVEQLSCDVLKNPDPEVVRYPASKRGWTPVFLRTGAWAYVEAKSARSTDEEYMGIRKRDGRWLVVRFLPPEI